MRHLKKGKKLSREKKQRNALIKHLASALILNEKIKTTQTRAKVLKTFVEKIISKSKAGSISSRRYLASVLSDKAAKKTFDTLGPRYKNKPGGYVRIIKLPPRISDGAKITLVEFT